MLRKYKNLFGEVQQSCEASSTTAVFFVYSSIIYVKYDMDMSGTGNISKKS